jgi:endonuclease-8
VPEGDTIHRTAAALRTALAGAPLVAFRAPRLVGPAPAPGRVVESVTSHGKHLEVVFDDGIVLHTHMRMTGSWHLYRAGERWRKPLHQMRVHVEVLHWSAVCFNAPVVETYRSSDRLRRPGAGGLGPDLCRDDADLAECVQRLLALPDADTPLADVLLDQRVCCGVGNVYKCEVLWACGLHPLERVGDLSADDAAALVHTAARLLRANLQHADRVTVAGVPGGLAVYGRHGRRCHRCGTAIRVQRLGRPPRVTYWCEGCQPARPSTRSTAISMATRSARSPGTR